MTASPHLTTYVASGKVSMRAPLRLLLAGVPGAVIMGGLYALWLHYSPAALISALGLALFSVFVGVLAWTIAQKGHSRSRRFNAATGAVLGFVALWAHWIVWTWLGFDQGPKMATYFAASGPLGWVRFLSMLSARLAQLEPNRFLVHWLPLLWLGEAAMLLWLPASIARMAADEPYSESASAWAKKDVEGELWWDGGDSSELPARLEREGVGFLLGLPRAVEVGATVASQWWTISAGCHQVESDAAARWVDVVVVQTRDDKGKVKSERKPVVSHWTVDASDYDRLATHLRAKAVDTGGEDPKRPTPPELAGAVAALERDEFALALQLAEAQRDHLNEATRADALRLCALSLARLEQWERAFADYLALFEVEPSVLNALQLATTSVMCGQLERGQAWFQKASELNVDSHAIPWPKLHTNFLSALEQKGELAAGLPHIEWLRHMFEGMTTTDDHVVFMHGMPFLSYFFERSLPFLRAVKSDAEVVAWYAGMRERLDEEGREKLDAWLAELEAATA